MEQQAPEDGKSHLDHKRLAKTLVRARAERVELLGDEEVERQADALVVQLRDGTSAAKQRADGHRSPGRREKYGVLDEDLPGAWAKAVRKLKGGLAPFLWTPS